MAFFYLDGRLKVGTPEADSKAILDVTEIARAFDRPVYLYDLDNVRARLDTLRAAFAGSEFTVHYAMKANSNPALLERFAAWGAGVDTVSGGEIRVALDAGIQPERIIFSGVGKTVAEIELALVKGIKQINVESPAELRRIADIAARLGKTADIAFRMNPDVNPQTHPYITTGFRENKFGMDESFLPELKQILEDAGPSLRLRGLTMHIGSQLMELDSIREALTKTIAVFQALRAEGYALDRLDIGGGLGIDYASADEGPELERVREYGRVVREELKNLKVEILLEPGRILVGRAGILIGEVQYVKSAPAKTFAILNTGMNHLMRPALYSARHRVLPVIDPRHTITASAPTLSPEKARPATHHYDVVGPICESSDVLARDVSLPTIEQGDLLAIADAGAYGFSMASRYNLHEMPAEVLVADGKILKS
jgi:diaminopimelate decarboxylase